MIISQFSDESSMTNPQISPETCGNVHLTVQTENYEFWIPLIEIQPGIFQIRDNRDYFLLHELLGIFNGLVKETEKTQLEYNDF